MRSLCPVSLIERPPRSAAVRTQMAEADRYATLIAGAGWIFTLATLLGLPGPDAWFMFLAPAIGTLAAGGALTGVFMQRYRGGFGRTLLAAGAAALVAVGVFYLGRASIPRAIAGYFVPAAMFVAAAAILRMPRARAA